MNEHPLILFALVMIGALVVGASWTAAERAVDRFIGWLMRAEDQP